MLRDTLIHARRLKLGPLWHHWLLFPPQVIREAIHLPVRLGLGLSALKILYLIA